MYVALAWYMVTRITQWLSPGEGTHYEGYHYYPLFRVKSWNNRTRCMSLYSYICSTISTPFVWSLEYLYSFHRYIWAKMSKMSYFVVLDTGFQSLLYSIAGSFRQMVREKGADVGITSWIRHFSTFCVAHTWSLMMKSVLNLYQPNPRERLCRIMPRYCMPCTF